MTQMNNFNTWEHENISIFLLHTQIIFQRVGYIINGVYININVFLLFFSFFFSLSSNREKEGESI